MLRTIICCLLSVLPILIGGCGAGQGGDVLATAAPESTAPLVASVLHTPTPTAQQPPSPIGTPAASTAPHLASYIGPNAYRQSYPDFIVYYDRALWTFMRNPDGVNHTLESTQVLSCSVLLSMGPMETANVRYKQADLYRWQISDTIDPRGFLYSTLEGDGLSLFFGLRMPDAEESGRNQECAHLAEDVMGTAAFVSAAASTPQPAEQGPSKYYPPVSDRTDEIPVPLTPEPYTPPTPYPEAATFSDADGIVTLTVPKGWYSAPPPLSILQSEAVIANFDLESMAGAPAEAILVHIAIGQIEAGQTFEQWLAQRIRLERFPEAGVGAEIVTEPQPIRLAKLSGLTYTLQTGSDGRVERRERVVQEIFLPLRDRYVFGAIIDSITAPDYAAAMSMLETLQIADIK